MANYKIVFKQSVAKDLLSIPLENVRHLLERINRLASEPRPPDVEKLSDKKYVIRQEAYRILYTIEHEIITVTLVRARGERD